MTVEPHDGAESSAKAYFIDCNALYYINPFYRNITVKKNVTCECLNETRHEKKIIGLLDREQKNIQVSQSFFEPK